MAIKLGFEVVDVQASSEKLQISQHPEFVALVVKTNAQIAHAFTQFDTAVAKQFGLFIVKHLKIPNVKVNP